MPVLAAVEKDMCDGLSSRSAVAARAGDVWHSSGEEKVVKSDLLGPQLHQQRALPLSEPLVEPEYFLGGRWSVSVGCSALGVLAPLCYPCPFGLYAAPSFRSRPYGEQLGRRVCRQASAAVFSPSGGFLGRFVDGLVPGYADVGRYPSDGHCPSVVLELPDLSRDVREDVGA
ncbi:hypothetical protein IG631_18811 [Alternaria alternata]|nr:hypothetical protein IG631_18811 [Alternaria alternata]